MEDGVIMKSPAVDEVINLSYKMFLILLPNLAMFSPVATDFESDIAQRIARFELFFEYHESHPNFK